MQLYYSSSIQVNGNQPYSFDSLGGLVSGNTIPNDIINNLFSDTTDNKNPVYRGVFLKNTTGAVITLLKLKMLIPSTCKDLFSFALVVPNASGAIERLSSENSAPLYSPTFTPFTHDWEQQVSVNIPVNGFVGIWFKKQTPLQPKSNQQYYDDYIALNNIKQKIEDNIALTSEEQLIYDYSITHVNKIQLILTSN